VSTGKSWEAVAQNYRLLSEPQIRPDQVKEFVRGTTPASTSQSDSESRLAFIQALVSKLHKEVRYTGIEFGQSELQPQPQPPSEVLKRHYGDCKDKASLLVAMLRDSGIPADMALLNAGPARDVTPELPGMNQFDHAIVYVPAAAPGGEALWIDATAEFTRVGDIPYGDQGRLALIIADGTKELTSTPVARPEDSVLIETRDFSCRTMAQPRPSSPRRPPATSIPTTAQSMAIPEIRRCGPRSRTMSEALTLPKP